MRAAAQLALIGGSTMKPRPLYMSTVTDAIAGGDLEEMKEVEKAVEKHL
jgi:hypothetical protein